MLYIEKYDPALNCRELECNGGTEVFHKALKYVCKGEERFHVHNKKGEDFDLSYIHNDYEMEHTPGYNRLFVPLYFTINGTFLTYREDDKNRLMLDLFNGFGHIYFHRLNEYTVVLCRLLLEYTDKDIYFKDNRINYFYEDSRIKVMEAFPREVNKNSMQVTGSFLDQSGPNGDRRVYDITLFNSVFFVDSLTDRELSELKYVEFSIDKVEGIGAILINYLKAQKIFERFGLKVALKYSSCRYSTELLEKYFKFEKLPEDANEDNTIYIPNYFGAVLTCVFFETNINCELRTIVKDEVIDQMEAYRSAVFGDKKVLGLIVRGTDYQKNAIIKDEMSRDAFVEMVKERMEGGGFDTLFLATEDSDVLHIYREAFPGKLLALSQERYSIRDFDDNTNTLADVEKHNKSSKEHEESVEDTTINYMYAIYILTKCDGFIANTLTYGAKCVLSFTTNEFSCCEILGN